ncbi:MAG: VOC family protein [Phyllobacteriaceae bacterium]|nr:VOC family protein [Phyllobacteriaceae bacterium]
MSDALRSLPTAVRGRGLDHVVAAVAELERAAETWERLGFRLTPPARHPWGTENRVIQLDGSFVEILAVADASILPEPTETAFSFGAWNRDFLARRGEGLSMLVLESTDPAADRAAFARAGLRTFEPFGFERVAVSPEGEARTVGFDLTFAAFTGAGENGEPDAGFFTCRQRFPENFWRADHQSHPNTARRLDAAVFVAPDPSDFHEGLSAFAGVREFHATSAGLVIPTPRGAIEVVTPAAFRWRWGAEALPETPDRLTLAALRFGVSALGEAASQLVAGGFTVADRAGAFVVTGIHGATVAFEAIPQG